MVPSGGVIPNGGRVYPVDPTVWRVAGIPLAPPLASGPLDGLGVAVKDLIAVEGYPTGGGVPAYLASQSRQPASAPVVTALRQAGGGSIVNLSSSAGKFGFPMRSPYSAAKWGVVGLTRTLAIELGTDRIRVNAILPGAVDGPRIRSVIRNKAQALGVSENEQTERTLANVSLRCFVTQQDIANMALYLCSPFGATISGQAISVDGGMESLA